MISSSGGLSGIGKGILLGTLAIAVFYAFAGADYRFSRAIILLDGLAALVLAYLVRLARYAVLHKRVSFTLDDTIKTIIVGNKEEVERVQYLLAHSKAKSDYLGYMCQLVVSNEQPTVYANSTGTWCRSI